MPVTNIENYNFFTETISTNISYKHAIFDITIHIKCSCVSYHCPTLKIFLAK